MQEPLKPEPFEGNDSADHASETKTQPDEGADAMQARPGQPAEGGREGIEDTIARFSHWLRERHEQESGGISEPDAGALPPVDLFSLYGELKGLREDVKRDLKRSADFQEEFRTGLERMQESLELSPADGSAARKEIEELGRKLDRQARDIDLSRLVPLVEPLFDLYDRIARAIAVLEGALARRGFLFQLSGLKSELEGYLEAQKMLLKKFEANLRRLGIQVTGVCGEPHEPATMTVLEARPAQGAAEGTVLEVVRHGFVAESRVLRAAEVVVAKASGEPSGEARRSRGE